MLGQLFLAKGGSKMKRIAIVRDWTRKAGQKDMQPALRKCNPYLEDRMLFASTITSYLNRVKLFLEWAKKQIRHHPASLINSGTLPAAWRSRRNRGRYQVFSRFLRRLIPSLLILSK